MTTDSTVVTSNPGETGNPGDAGTPPSTATGDPNATGTPANETATGTGDQQTTAKPGEGETTKPDASTSETKPGEGKPTDVPDKYEIKLGQDAIADANVVERTATLAKSLSLSNEHAQTVLDHINTELVKHTEGLVEQHAERIKGWVTEMKGDKDIGGDNFDQSSKLAQQVFAKFGNPELKTALEESGYGNFPPLVRMLVKIGNAMSEDNIQQGGTGTAEAEKDLASRMYPKQAAQTT